MLPYSPPLAQGLPPYGGRCTAVLSTITNRAGTTVPAYVRDDGAVLLAHYGPRMTVRDYDPDRAQIASTTTSA